MQTETKEFHSLPRQNATPVLLGFKMYCLLKVATQRCFPLWIKKLFSCVVLNLYCYIRAAKGKDDSLLVLGQTWVSRKNPAVALFPVALNDMRRDAVSHTGQLTAYTKQWPSLWQDQGITLNPPDRCHMHARAHKYTRKQKWWQRGGSKTEGDINLKKKKPTLSRTQSSGHCLYCCRTHILYSAVSCKVSNYAQGILFHPIAS